MSGFRRFVIGLSGFCSFVLIVGFAIIAGFGGAIAIGLISGRSDSAAIGFIVGAALGFFFAALPAAMMFTLTEIAENTRKTVRLLEGVAVQPPSPGPSQPAQQSRIRIRPE
jgi:hypothetical protein